MYGSNIEELEKVLLESIPHVQSKIEKFKKTSINLEQTLSGEMYTIFRRLLKDKIKYTPFSTTSIGIRLNKDRTFITHLWFKTKYSSKEHNEFIQMLNKALENLNYDYSNCMFKCNLNNISKSIEDYAI